MVNTSALESRGRGFKSRSRQFLEFHLCSFISFFHWFQFICVMYIYIYNYTPRARLFEHLLQLRVSCFLRSNHQATARNETQNCSKCSNNLALGVQLFIALALPLGTL